MDLIKQNFEIHKFVTTLNKLKTRRFVKIRLECQISVIKGSNLNFQKFPENANKLFLNRYLVI